MLTVRFVLESERRDRTRPCGTVRSILAASIDEGLDEIVRLHGRRGADYDVTVLNRGTYFIEDRQTRGTFAHVVFYL